MLGRILRSADFERVLGIPACARSSHFAVHFLAARPSRPASKRAPDTAQSQPLSRKLSTGDEPGFAQPVDEWQAPALLKGPAGGPQAWLGTVVPKRHAKRAVTRNLLKRQIRAALLRQDVPGQTLLRSGLWVVRLRAPFDRVAFASAASATLRAAARCEIEAVLGQAARRLASALTPPLGAG